MMQASLGPRGVSSLFPHSTGSHASHARPSALRSPCDAQPPPAPPPTLPSGVFLACLTRGPRPTTSVAFYSTASRVLHVGAFPDASVVAHLKHRVQPTLILTAAQPDSDAFHALAHNDLDPAAPFAVRSLKAAAWTAEAGLQRLRLLRLSSSPDVQQRAHPFRHLMHVRALVDTADPLITSVLGALLTHLGGEGGGGDCLTVDDIRAVSGDWVRVDRWTVRGLGVFREDGHPGAGGRGKEGLSVFGVCDRTVSGVGRKALRQWLLWPTRDRGVLERRLDAVEWFTQPENDDVTAALCASLGKVKDVPRLVKKFCSSGPNAKDWRSLSNCLHHLLSIHETMARLPSRPSCFSSFESLSASLAPLSQALRDILDLDGGDERIAVRLGVNDVLDDLRDRLHGLPSFLASLTRSDREARRDLRGVEFEYVSRDQYGFLLTISEAVDCAPLLSQMRWMYTDGGRHHLKEARTEQLDAEFGDLRSRIHDVETRFVAGLQEKVIQLAPHVLAAATRVYELDCHIALAKAATSLGLVRPELNDGDGLSITGGRHLLQASCVAQFIPNDTALGQRRSDGGGEVHVITGPNGSGKSVYLQQVGVIAYLALCGSFVPARAASVPLLDGIYSALTEKDSTGSDMSSFCQEVSRVAYMQRHATQRSLCLLDEFGKGTATDDGVSLLAATLTHWIRRPSSCPLVLATTHFHEAFTCDLLPPFPLLRTHSMSFIEESQSAPPADAAPSSPTSTLTVQRSPAVLPSIVPLFTLVPGICTDSFGLACARQAGLPTRLVERAAELQRAFHRGARIERWAWVSDEGHKGREEQEGERRIVREFERLVRVGLERANPLELVALVDAMQAEDKWIAAERAEQAMAAPVPPFP